MTRSYVWHDSFIDMTHSHYTVVSHICDMTRAYVWNELFIDMTHSHRSWYCRLSYLEYMPYSKTTDQLSSKTKDNTQNTTQSSLNTSRLCRLRIRLRNINESSLKYESFSKKTHLYSRKTQSTHSCSKTKEHEVMFMPFQKRAISKTTKL